MYNYFNLSACFAPCFFILTAVAEEVLIIVRAIESGEINLNKL
ncbi:MAG: hypothetical protein Ct9H300mP4_10080 [Gammaproteobacteria bacterium]|nr:MAG: hypothetical protein Ct9H300mP4_10080 [Gammaproteobacteria bacterium]